MQNKISIFSFFSGVGILDLAFEKTGYNIVFVNEYNNFFLDSYKYARTKMHLSPPIYGYNNNSAERFSHRRGKKHLLKLISLEQQKGNIVGFIGGPPCPDFSVAGKNAGSTGSNGRLTKVYFDLICRCKPDFFLFENVKGLIKTKKHNAFFNEMKMKLNANQYIITEQLINALSYGVPQFRERIFLIGIKKNVLLRNPNYISSNHQLVFDWNKFKKFDSQQILNLNWPTTRQFMEDSTYVFNYKVPKRLTVEYWFKQNDVCTHPNNNDVFTVRNGQNKINTIFEGDTKGKSFKRLHRWRFSPTAAYGHNEVHLHPYKARRISVAEAMAIQSLPKKFCIPPEISLTNKFKMIGNGVPYLMAQAIAKTLFDLLANLQEEHNEKDNN